MENVKIFLMVVAMISATMATQCAEAAPLRNYEPGHFQVSAGGNLPMKLTEYGQKFNGMETLYLNGTIGLTKHLALEADCQKYKYSSAGYKNNVTSANLHYKVIDGISVFTGYENSKTILKIPHFEQEEQNKDIVKVGVSARYDIPLFFTVFGKADYNKDSKGVEVGISKLILNNLYVDVSYFARQDIVEYKGNAVSPVMRGVKLGFTLEF